MAEIIERLLGFDRVERRDHSTVPDGTHDFDLFTSGGAALVLEVTRLTSFVRRRQERSVLEYEPSSAHLKRSWDLVTHEYGTRLAESHKRLVSTITQLEQLGVHQFSALGDYPDAEYRDLYATLKAAGFPSGHSKPAKAGACGSLWFNEVVQIPVTGNEFTRQVQDAIDDNSDGLRTWHGVSVASLRISSKLAGKISRHPCNRAVNGPLFCHERKTRRRRHRWQSSNGSAEPESSPSGQFESLC